LSQQQFINLAILVKWGGVRVLKLLRYFNAIQFRRRQYILERDYVFAHLLAARKQR
jgi:hypothetical protein